MDNIVRLDDWFAKRLVGLHCEPTTLAYVVGVFTAFRSSRDDLSNESLVLTWDEARSSGNFETFQRIGDWVLWVETFCPRFTVGHSQVTRSVGQLAYLSCHRMVGWPLYEELANNLEAITFEARERFGSLDLG